MGLNYTGGRRTVSSNRSPKKVQPGRLLVIRGLLAIAVACFVMAAISHFTDKEGVTIWVTAMSATIASLVLYSIGRTSAT